MTMLCFDSYLCGHLPVVGLSSSVFNCVACRFAVATFELRGNTCQGLVIFLNKTVDDVFRNTNKSCIRTSNRLRWINGRIDLE